MLRQSVLSQVKGLPLSTPSTLNICTRHGVDACVLPGDELDASSVKRMLLSFEKKVLRNQEMRVKFPDMPEKFMESELELNDELQKLHVIATVPEHYPILVDTNALQTILGLLTHDNSDISIAVIDLLQELTDEGATTDSEEEVEGLVDALLAEGVSSTRGGRVWCGARKVSRAGDSSLADWCAVCVAGDSTAGAGPGAAG